MLRRSDRLRILECVSKAAPAFYTCHWRIRTIELMRTGILRSQLGWLKVGHGRDVGAVWLEGEVLSGV